MLCRGCRLLSDETDHVAVPKPSSALFWTIAIRWLMIFKDSRSVVFVYHQRFRLLSRVQVVQKF